MRRYFIKFIAAPISILLVAGSAACVRAEPVCTPEATCRQAAEIAATAPVDTPLPKDTPIPASAFAETYFRRAGDAPEVVVWDDEHGHWEYRADTLDVRIDCVSVDLGRGNVTYFVVDIHVQGGEQLRDVPAKPGGELPWRLARENRAVLLLTGNTADASNGGLSLVIDGEPAPGLMHAPGRGVDARTGIGAVSDGHYIAILADGRQPGYSVGLTLSELADIFVEHGAWEARYLSGGREAALVFMGEHLHHHAGVYAGADPSYQARIDCGLAFGSSALVPGLTDAVKNDGNA